MPAIKNRNPGAELKQLLRTQPNTAVIEFLIADVNGILRGKQVRPREFESCINNGFVMPGSTVLLDSLGDVIDGVRWSAHDGDPDLQARYVPGSLAPVPWARKPTAQALFRLFGDDEAPFALDPRRVLERSAARLRRRCPTIVVAAELEFYLLDARADRPTPRASRVPGLGRPQPGPQVYAPDELWEVEAFLDELHAVCSAQSIPAGTTTSEFSPGQYEVNLHHVDDPVLACDHAVLLKRAIKSVARRHGFVACFMAKPFEALSGSGLHLHLSLYGRDGKNAFSRDRDSLSSPPYSARLRQAVGGLQQTMPESMAFFAPNANSYRRLREDSFAPVEPNWGANHRGVALRIPMSTPDNLRIEHRTAGADANPYLVTAAVLAGIDHGMSQRIEPGPMVEEAAHVHLKKRLPDRWHTALRKTARSRILADYLGKEFLDAFLANRRQEEQAFHNAVSDRDYDWYLRGV